MKPMMIVVTFIAALAVTGLGFAQSEQAAHCKQAREHVNAAVTAGAKGDAQALVQHAEVGLEHVKLADKAKPIPDLNKAIKSLEEAIKLGKAGDAAKATEHAKESVEYIDAAAAALGG